MGEKLDPKLGVAIALATGAKPTTPTIVDLKSNSGLAFIGGVSSSKQSFFCGDERTDVTDYEPPMWSQDITIPVSVDAVGEVACLALGLPTTTEVEVGVAFKHEYEDADGVFGLFFDQLLTGNNEYYIYNALVNKLNFDFPAHKLASLVFGAQGYAVKANETERTVSPPAEADFLRAGAVTNEVYSMIITPDGGSAIDLTDAANGTKWNIGKPMVDGQVHYNSENKGLPTHKNLELTASFDYDFAKDGFNNLTSNAKKLIALARGGAGTETTIANSQGKPSTPVAFECTVIGDLLPGAATTRAKIKLEGNFMFSVDWPQLVGGADRVRLLTCNLEYRSGFKMTIWNGSEYEVPVA